MLGCLSGVAKRFKDDCPKALTVHCMAHSLNLCLQEVSSHCMCIKEALSITSELSSLIRASPKRLSIFKHIQADISPGNPQLKPLCPTRWTVRTSAIGSVLMKYEIICQELEVLSRHSSAESSRRALRSVALAKSFLIRHRSEESFSNLYKEAAEEAKELSTTDSTSSKICT